MLSKFLKMKISLNEYIAIVFVLVAIGLATASLNSLFGEPMLAAVQVGPWYGPLLPFSWP